MKITTEDFRYFEKKVRYWLKYFQLGDWAVDVVNMEEPDGVDGSCKSIFRQRNAAINISTDIGVFTESEEAKRVEIDTIAFHESCELLLAELRHAATDRHSTEETIEAAIHGVISRLTNTIFRLDLP